MAEPHDLKRDWDARARENPRFYVATTAWRTEEEFESSGARDAAHLFGGIEELLTPDAVVLDLGCGIGRMDRYVAPRVKRLVGLDVSGEMVRLARQRLADVGNVEFVEGDGESLAPFADANFDLVFSFTTFQHLPDEVFASYLREIPRVLRRGGHFVVQLVGSTAPLRDRRATSTFDDRFHDEVDVRRRLEAAGFAIRGSARQTVQVDAIPFDIFRIDAERL